MGNTCSPAPLDKAAYISQIGKILVRKSGKKKYYKPEEVKKAHRESRWYDGADFSCWAMCTFSSHSDFDAYHQATGEVCDYSRMKAEMLSGLSISTATDPSSLPISEIDASWLDFEDVFGGIVEGIGDIVGAIFDAF